MSLEAKIYNQIWSYPTIFKHGLDHDAKYDLLKAHDRKYHLVIGFHGSRKAMDFIKDNVELCLSDPKQWLFLIEGAEATERYGISCDEGGYAFLLAKSNGISIHDPIIDPGRPEIVQQAIEQGQSPGIVYLSILDALGGSAISFNFRYGMPESVFDYLADMYNNMDNNERRTNLHPVFERLSRLSTDLSREVLRKLLLENHQPNVLIYIGDAHKEMIDILR